MQKIKVLHLFNSYLPQTENWIYNMLQYLPQIENHLFARRYLMNNFYHNSFKFVNNPLSSLHHYTAESSGTKINAFIKRVFIKLISILLGNEEKLLMPYLKRQQINVIHAHFADVGWFFLFLIKKSKVPYIISFYGWDYEQLPYLKPVYQARYQELFARADAILCEGPHGASILENAGCPSSKLKIVKLGVETEKIPFFRRSKKEQELHLVQVATFTEKKGHLYTVLAFMEALQTCPNMTLTLIGGDGGTKQHILQLIKEHNMEAYIKTEDRLEWASLHERLKDYQVFIHPSCYTADRDCEGGAPIVLLDAQATGMPVIATRHCDIPEEVVDGVSGWLAGEKEIGELSNHIAYFYHCNQAKFDWFSDNASKFVKKNFAVHQLSKSLETLYKDICNH